MFSRHVIRTPNFACAPFLVMSFAQASHTSCSLAHAQASSVCDFQVIDLLALTCADLRHDEAALNKALMCASNEMVKRPWITHLNDSAAVCPLGRTEVLSQQPRSLLLPFGHCPTQPAGVFANPDLGGVLKACQVFTPSRAL